MDSSEATLARERCAVHADRPAVGVCGRCGRRVCLDCAIPFRGEVRCERCAALELGDPEPDPEPARARPGVPHVQLLALAVSLGATIPPWHRSGTLTSRLSAWNLGLDGWAGSACILAGLALLVAALGILRPSVRERAVPGAAILATAAAIAIGVAVAREPAFFSSTLAPFVALGATVVAGGIGAFRLLRRPLGSLALLA